MLHSYDKQHLQHACILGAGLNSASVNISQASSKHKRKAAASPTSVVTTRRVGMATAEAVSSRCFARTNKFSSIHPIA